MKIDNPPLDGSNEIWGIISMLIAVFAGAFKSVFAHAIISDTKKEMGILSFTFWMEIIVSVILLPWAFSTGEAITMSQMDPNLYSIVLFTSLYGGVRIFSQLYFLKYTSPTSLALSLIHI